MHPGESYFGVQEPCKLGIISGSMPDNESLVTMKAILTVTITYLVGKMAL